MPKVKKHSHATRAKKMRDIRANREKDHARKEKPEQDQSHTSSPRANREKGHARMEYPEKDPSYTSSPSKIRKIQTQKDIKPVSHFITTDADASETFSPLMRAYLRDQEHRQAKYSRTVKANLHQGSTVFADSAGKQCTCNCAAFLLDTFSVPIDDMNPHCLDAILQEGTKFYKKCSKLLGQEFLMVKELEGPILYKKQYYHMSILQEYSGLSDSAENFWNALLSALEVTTYVFVLLGDAIGASYTSAVYRASDNTFYSFDPHARDSSGLPSPSGTAVLIHHTTRQSLRIFGTILARTLHTTYYEVVAVSIETTTASDYRQFYMKCAKQKERREMCGEKCESIKKKNTERRQEKRSDLNKERREEIKRKDTESRREKHSELQDEQLEDLKQKNTQSRRGKRSELNEEQREEIKRKETEGRKEKRSELQDEQLEDLKQKNTESRRGKRSELNAGQREEIKRKETEGRKEKRSLVPFEEMYKKAVKEAPIYVCCVCERTWYRNGVQVLSVDKYLDTDDRILKSCMTDALSFDEKKYICTGCHSSLMKNKMPGTAAANNLQVEDIPEALKGLTELESILVSQRIIFFKIVNLPRGRQKGTIGTFVNIPVDTESVCASLPRTPEQSGIIPLKLKRKLSYKGHHIHQNIRPESVVQALDWLIHNNDMYKNIRITSDWQKKCQEENSEVWDNLCGTNSQNHNESVETLPDNTQETSSIAHQEDNTDDDTEDVHQKVRGVQFNTCLHPSNQASFVEKEFCIAPGEGKYPLDPFMDTKCEALAFPDLFPYGHGTFLGDDDFRKRSIPITAKKYFIQRITNKDNRFSSSVSYLFYALNVCEKLQIQNSVNIALRKARRKDITVGELRNPENMRDIFIKDQAFQFLQQVRGSPSYWQLAQYELLAMVRARGVFTWFLTLSCADLQWPETIQSIGLHYGHIFTDDDVNSMSYEEKCSWLRRDAVLAAKNFDHRLQSFFRHIIMSSSGPLGNVTNFFQRIEFQLRGSPHCHAVLWVEDAPDLDKASEEEICNWIDTYINCNLPPEDDPLYEEVLSKQQHTHSVACRKHGDVCRFHYPKPPSDKTLLSKPDSNNISELTPSTSEFNSKTILSKVNDVLTSESIKVSDMGISQILTLAGVDETDYYNALRYSKLGTSVVYKRQTNSLNINNYNKDILSIWKANMDLQFVCDPYACIAYIAAYVTKDERELSQMLKDAAKEMRDADVKARLRKVGNVYLSNREVSAQEAAYRLLGIPMKRCSSRMVWIPTDLPQDRIGILKPQSVLDELEDEDTDVFALGIIDKYQKRPCDPLVNQLCLWEFASWYGTSQQPSTDDVEELTSDNNYSHPSLPKTIHLLDNQGVMRKYRRPAIPRYHVFSINKESEKIFHQQLMLFFPWRNEEDLKSNTSELPYESKYSEVEDAVLTKKAKLEHHSELVEDALRNYDENGPPQHAWDLLDPQAEQARSEDIQEIIQQTTDAEHRIEVSRPPSMLAVMTRPNAIKDQQLRNIIHSLNETQKKIFTHIINWCKNTVSVASLEEKPKPFHLFVTGGAGTGKSELIKAIYHQATRILQQPGDNPDYPVVLLTSPTGTASYNIGGTTLHSALHLPRGRYYSLRSNPSLLSTFRLSMSQLKILVIDEVSMVGRTMFAHIHRRIQEAKGLDKSDTVFGGISILAVGDFHQLPPVHQHKLFDANISNPDKVDPEELAVALAGFWEINFSMVQLSEIMRQKEDHPFSEMLNRLRTASHTDADIEALKTRMVSIDDPNYPHNALHIFSTCRDVHNHNSLMLNQQNETKHQVISVTKVPKVVKSYDVTRLVGGLSHEVTICRNARIMLIKNLDVADGLVNGATGVILDIIPGSQSSSMPKAVIVRFDNDKVGRMARQSSKIPLRSYKDGVPILPVQVKEHVGRSETSPEVTRIQIPIVLCWACTIHKVQGATLNQVVISFKGLRTKGQAYVAFSRVTTLQGMYLLDFKPEAIKADPAVTEEMKRLSEHIPAVLVTDKVSAPPTSVVRICFFNCQSFGPTRRKDIQHDPYINTSTILALTEIWRQHQSAGLYGYTEVASSVVRENVRGAALLCKTTHSLTPAALHLDDDHIDAVPGWMCIDSITTILLIVMYCPPRTPLTRIRNAISSFLDNVFGKRIIIGGDLNIDLSKDQGCAFAKWMEERGLRQLSKSPTHQSGSHIDHVWTNLPISSITMFDLWTCYSDHKQIFIDVNKQ